MTAVSKNVNIDKLDDLVNKYNNTYHRTVKVVNFKNLNLKLVIMLENQNTKTFLLKDILQVGLNTFL